MAPEIERRKEKNDSKGLLRFAAELLNGKQGRKAMFGIWGFFAANALISSGKIDQAIYWNMFLTCALLIGFGTVLDSVVAKVGDAISVFVGDKVAAILGKVTPPKKGETDANATTEAPQS